MLQHFLAHLNYSCSTTISVDMFCMHLLQVVYLPCCNLLPFISVCPSHSLTCFLTSLCPDLPRHHGA
jgi:hypothetical protein